MNATNERNLPRDLRALGPAVKGGRIGCGLGGLAAVLGPKNELVALVAVAIAVAGIGAEVGTSEESNGASGRA